MSGARNSRWKRGRGSPQDQGTRQQDGTRAPSASLPPPVAPRIKIINKDRLAHRGRAKHGGSAKHSSGRNVRSSRARASHPSRSAEADEPTESAAGSLPLPPAPPPPPAPPVPPPQGGAGRIARGSAPCSTNKLTGDGRTVFFHNVPFEMSADEIEEMFCKAGRVTDLRLFRFADGSSKGQGLCQFETLASAVRAIRVLYGTLMSCGDGERELFVKMHLGDDVGGCLDVEIRPAAVNSSHQRLPREQKKVIPHPSESPASWQKQSANSSRPQILKPVPKRTARHHKVDLDHCSEIAQPSESPMEEVAHPPYDDDISPGVHSKSPKSVSRSRSRSRSGVGMQVDPEVIEAAFQCRYRTQSRSRSRSGVVTQADQDLLGGAWAPSADHDEGEADDLAAEWEEKFLVVAHKGEDDSEPPDSQDDPLGLYQETKAGDNGQKHAVQEAGVNSGESQGDYDVPSEPD